jgi:Reverse transcriptase (RNA-dependent DNA polymerase)
VVARLLVYVDDCFIAGRTLAVVQDVLESIQTWFESRDLGEPVDFLGFEITRDRAQRVATISQPAYVRKILAQYDAVGLPPVKVPRLHTIALRADGDTMGEELDHDLYPRVVGSLQHLANCTRPDIQQAVSTLARYVKAPREAHWKAAMHLLVTWGARQTTASRTARRRVCRFFTMLTMRRARTRGAV